MPESLSDDERHVKPLDEQADWVIAFVDDSRDKRQEFDDIWHELELNFLVRNFRENSRDKNTQFPLDIVGERKHSTQSGFSVLKDPETFQQVMTISAKMILALFPDDAFMRARRVGFEDILKAQSVSRLLEYVHRLPGHYQSFLEWIMGICVYGTGVMEIGWHYEEQPRPFRSLGEDEFGNEFDEQEILMAPTYDDVRKMPLHIRDFFGDPGATRIALMQGAAKRFKITSAIAKQRAEAGLYNKKATDQAIERMQSVDAREEEDHPHEDETTGQHVKRAHHSFKQLVGYEYYGTVPYKVSDGFQQRVVTVLAGETVRSEPWPRRIPFFEGRIVPRLGSFYGIGPAEIIRFDQDFADVLKRMLADAVVRMTHPPHLVNRNAGVDTAKLRAFRPNVPVMADQMGSVEQLPYAPPVGPAFQMYAGAKQQMRESYGVLGAIQGLGLGTNRKSATEASATFEQAFDRPEMFTTVLEREYLPPMAKYDLALYQEFLEDDDDLRVRIGDSEAVATLSDILADFDVKFIGSRVEGTRSERAQSSQLIFQASANPIVAQLIPWIPFLRKWFEDVGQPEIAAMIGNPGLVQLNTILTQIGQATQQSGNGANPPAEEPQGLLPAQTTGGQVLT